MTNQLSFNDKSLTPIIQNNQIWLTARDLTEALGYKTSNAVTKIFYRNKDEFTECMTCLPNLGKQSRNENKSRIFSLRGCHLIAMFSRTEQAKAFRHWVLNILDKEISQVEPEEIKPVREFGFCRILMVFENGQLVDSHPLSNDQGIVSFSSPKILKEMIRDAMPSYALVHKADLTKIFDL